MPNSSNKGEITGRVQQCNSDSIKGWSQNLLVMPAPLETGKQVYEIRKQKEKIYYFNIIIFKSYYGQKIYSSIYTEILQNTY